MTGNPFRDRTITEEQPDLLDAILNPQALLAERDRLRGMVAALESENAQHEVHLNRLTGLPDEWVQRSKVGNFPTRAEVLARYPDGYDGPVDWTGTETDAGGE